MENQNNKPDLLGSAPVSKALRALGLPIMVGMLINALYNLADAYFVGGLGQSPMGAISVAFPLGQTVVGLGLMFGNGAASCLSRLLGLGRGGAGFFLGACRQGLCFVPVILLLPRLWGLEGVLYAQPIADLLSAAVTLAVAGRLRRQLRQEESLFLGISPLQ